MFHNVAKKINVNEININNQSISINKKFHKINFYESIENIIGESIESYSLKDLYLFANKNNIDIDKNLTKGKVLDKIFSIIVEPTLIEPTFVFDYPIEISPLAKKSRKNKKNIVERFELFIGGFELANSFTELNDPIDQKHRFLEQEKYKSSNDEEIQKMDVDFLESMEIGMPPTGGVGIGIDRLVMLLTSTETIKDVILFPTLKTL
jgi:lysyl-tRNA synthetase class 2